MTVWTSVLWKMSMWLTKKRPEMVIKRPFVIKIRFETVYKTPIDKWFFIRYINFYLFNQKTLFNSKRHKFNSVSFYRRHSVDCIQDWIKITNYNSIFLIAKLVFVWVYWIFQNPIRPYPLETCLLVVERRDLLWCFFFTN